MRLEAIRWEDIQKHYQGYMDNMTETHEHLQLVWGSAKKKKKAIINELTKISHTRRLGDEYA